MPAFLLKADASEVFKAFNELATNQIPFATALALTRTAQAAVKQIQSDLDSIFDRPTPFTKNAFYIRPATKANLVAQVQIKDAQTKYLTPEIEGGERRGKGFEGLLVQAGILNPGWFAVPTSAVPLDAYGNVPRGTITKILSQVQAARDSLTNEPAHLKQKRNKRMPSGRYFAVSTRDTTHLAPGIYERLGATFQSKIRPVFIFTPRPPRYTKRFDFYNLAQVYADQFYPAQFEAAIERAIATAR